MLSYQRSEFRLVIEEIIVVSDFLYFGVIAGNGYIGDANLTLMSSSKFNSILGYFLYNHHIISLIGDTLEHNMLSRWFLNRQQLILNVFFLDVTRILILAYLAIEFLEVILNGASNQFLLHL
jgi:hypothetical protein